ncbi:hypothetical protein P171DRAFT_482547 [Karstenula rhodostoma CBS 690.94]|uniref:Uncharacterized protein n=1 Tax=Karstenula rhodostoma CBS 690.94 TaxID=1392251 RepID=A0A9P4PP73_9PLEO|nr:hypothetical protein P171DRAFT_482547 [Karstenula rhodostoma CBS 690.94]
MSQVRGSWLYAGSISSVRASSGRAHQMLYENLGNSVIVDWLEDTMVIEISKFVWTSTHVSRSLAARGDYVWSFISLQQENAPHRYVSEQLDHFKHIEVDIPLSLITISYREVLEGTADRYEDEFHVFVEDERIYFPPTDE